MAKLTKCLVLLFVISIKVVFSEDEASSTTQSPTSTPSAKGLPGLKKKGMDMIPRSPKLQELGNETLTRMNNTLMKARKAGANLNEAIMSMNGTKIAKNIANTGVNVTQTLFKTFDFSQIKSYVQGLVDTQKGPQNLTLGQFFFKKVFNLTVPSPSATPTKQNETNKGFFYYVSEGIAKSLKATNNTKTAANTTTAGNSTALPSKQPVTQPEPQTIFSIMPSWLSNLFKPMMPSGKNETKGTPRGAKPAAELSRPQEETIAIRNPKQVPKIHMNATEYRPLPPGQPGLGHLGHPPGHGKGHHHGHNKKHHPGHSHGHGEGHKQHEGEDHEESTTPVPINTKQSTTAEPEDHTSKPQTTASATTTEEVDVATAPNR